jgi:biotin carboxylase
MDRWVIVFVSSECRAAEGPLVAAKASRFRTLLAATSRPCVDDDLVDRFVQIPDRSSKQVAEYVIAQCEGLHVAGIVASDDWDVVAAAMIAERLHLRFVSVETALAATNKFVMRERLRNNGATVPDFQCFAIGDDPREIAKSLQFPVVIKPTYGQGSQGVIRANTVDEFELAYQYTSRIIIDFDMRPSAARDRSGILIEQYIPGEEYVVELLMHGGKAYPLAVFEKPDPLEGPYFEEGIYVTPIRKDEDVRSLLVEAAIQGGRALGIETGPCHCELRLSGHVPYILEIAARPIGGFCSQVFADLMGFDLHDIIVRNAVGLPVPPPRVLDDAASGVMMLPVPGRGVLKKVSGVEQARDIDGVRSVTIHVGPGARIFPYPEQSCYIGTVLATGTSADEVIARLKSAANTVSFELGQ